jgi:hypothetical protein
VRPLHVRRLPVAHCRFLQITLCALVLGLSVAGAARPADPLEDAKRRQEIAAQQLEADVRETLRQVNDLARTNPQKAIAKLRDLIDTLNDDTALTTARRDTLKALAKGRIRDLETDAARRTSRNVEDAERAARSSQRHTDEDRRADDAARLARGLQDVQSLRGAGRTTEANQLQSDLARRYPDSTAAAASRTIADRADRVVDTRRNRGEAATGFQGAMESLDRSAVAESGDYVLPPDWKTRVAKRTNGPKLTDQEKQTLKALATPIKAELKDMPLSGVLDYLQETTGVTIISDKKTLEAAGATYETPITTKFKSSSLRTILKKVLADVGLTYIVKEGAVRVVTPEEARNSMTVRSYYVGDLAGVVDITVSPLLRDIQMRAAIGQIIDGITGSIDPNSWESHGAQGGGTITYDPITMSLIVKQTAEVHYMLSSSGH